MTGAELDWARLGGELDAQGSAVIARLMSRTECEGLAALYADDARFRSRVVMRRHGFGQGDAVLFAVNERPVQGTRGAYRVKLRHGVSRVRSGQRHTAGIIFHDAA